MGCSGGIGSDSGATSMLLDSDILIDAGAGVGNLALQELVKIDHIFITHAHLNHIVVIPFLVDTVGCMRQKPITIYATEATLNSLRNHLFNWHIWPDFTKIPDTRYLNMRYEVISQGMVKNLNGRKIVPLPANHAVPSVGYLLDSDSTSFVFTGDATTNDAL